MAVTGGRRGRKVWDIAQQVHQTKHPNSSCVSTFENDPSEHSDLVPLWLMFRQKSQKDRKIEVMVKRLTVKLGCRPRPSGSKSFSATTTSRYFCFYCFKCHIIHTLIIFFSYPYHADCHFKEGVMSCV